MKEEDVTGAKDIDTEIVSELDVVMLLVEEWNAVILRKQTNGRAMLTIQFAQRSLADVSIDLHAVVTQERIARNWKIVNTQNV